MSSHDRRVSRKAKRRQERIRQEKHARRSSSHESGGSTGPNLQPNDHVEDDRRFDGVDTPPASMFDTERSLRALNWMLTHTPPEDRTNVMTSFVSHGWKEGHAKMLLADQQERAQEKAFQAHEASRQIEALRLATDALQLDMDCCDAWTILAMHSAKNQDERIKRLEHAVACGHRALGGDTYLAEHRGRFWGITQARPYLRTRFALAVHLTDARRFREAAEHYAAIIDLNHTDNQGARDPLVACLLATGDLAAVAAAIAKHEDGGALIAWARVLERFLAGDAAGAYIALGAALRRHPRVGPILQLEPLHRPRSPNAYSSGSPQEAAYVADVLGIAWDAHPQAKDWLRTVSAVPGNSENSVRYLRAEHDREWKVRL